MSIREHFLHDSWLTAMTAIVISLLANRLSNFDGTFLIEWIPLLLSFATTFALISYIRLKAKTIDEIEFQIRFASEDPKPGVGITLQGKKSIYDERMKMKRLQRKSLFAASSVGILLTLASIVAVNLYESGIESHRQDYFNTEILRIQENVTEFRALNDSLSIEVDSLNNRFLTLARLLDSNKSEGIKSLNASD